MGFCKRKGVECECLTKYSNCNSDNCSRNLPDKPTPLNFAFCEARNIFCNKISTNSEEDCAKCVAGIEPEKDTIQTTNLNLVTGIYDTETKGKKFAIGTKNQTTGFVLNFGNRSCLLFTGDVMPIDLRQFNFDEFESIEINGNKFVREVKE